MIDHVLIFNTESGGLLYSCPADTYKGGDDPEVKALAAEYSCDGIEVHMGRPNDTLATCRALRAPEEALRVRHLRQGDP